MEPLVGFSVCYEWGTEKLVGAQRLSASQSREACRIRCYLALLLNLSHRSMSCTGLQISVEWSSSTPYSCDGSAPPAEPSFLINCL